MSAGEIAILSSQLQAAHTEIRRLKQERLSFIRLVELLRGKMKQSRADLITAHNQLADIGSLANSVTTMCKLHALHPETMSQEALDLIESIMLSPSMCELDRRGELLTTKNENHA